MLIVTRTNKVALVPPIKCWRTMASRVFRSVRVLADTINIPIPQANRFVKVAITVLVQEVSGHAQPNNVTAPVSHQEIRITSPSMVYATPTRAVVNTIWPKIKTTPSLSWPRMSRVVPQVWHVQRTSLLIIEERALTCNEAEMSSSTELNWITTNRFQKSTDKCQCSRVGCSPWSRHPTSWSNGTKQHESIWLSMPNIEDRWKVCAEITTMTMLMMLELLKESRVPLSSKDPLVIARALSLIDVGCF